MTMADVYCRFNRARGMELVSPDDLTNACKMFETLKQPMRLELFDWCTVHAQILLVDCFELFPVDGCSFSNCQSVCTSKVCTSFNPVGVVWQVKCCL